jgi:hypothetical protein
MSDVSQRSSDARDHLVMLEPNIVLCASSDRYLEAVLRGVDQAARTRALPYDLPEWKHIDFDAPVWMQIKEERLPVAIFNTPKLRDQLKVERQPDGTVVLSCARKLGEDTLWFGWQVCRMQAFELFLPDK